MTCFALLSWSTQVADQRALLSLALASTDRLFLEHMYRAMLELGLDEELLQVSGYATPHSSMPLLTREFCLSDRAGQRPCGRPMS